MMSPYSSNLEVTKNEQMDRQITRAIQIGSSKKLLKIYNTVHSEHGAIKASEIANMITSTSETPLLQAVRYNQSIVFKTLLHSMHADPGRTGWFSKNGFESAETTPLIASIVSGYGQNVRYITSLRPVEKVRQSFTAIMSSSMSRLDKINALETTGVAFIFSLRKKVQQIGVECWREAFKLRCATDDGQPISAKQPISLSDRLRIATGNVTEVSTMEQLEELSSELDDIHLLRQALLVNQRILTESPFSSKLFTLDLWHQFVLECKFRLKPRDLIDAALFLLELTEILMLNEDDNLKFRGDLIVDQSLKLLVSSLIDETKYLRLKTKKLDPTSFNCFIFTLEFISRSGANRGWSADDMMMKCILDLLDMLTRMELDDQETQRLKEAIKACSKRRWGKRRRTILQEACGSTWDCEPIPKDVIQLLLDSGIDPDALDGAGDAAFHILAGNLWWPPNREIFDMLTGPSSRMDIDS